MAGFGRNGWPVYAGISGRIAPEYAIMAVYPKPRTSRPGNGHKIYPYLLRGMTVHRPNQVWATDISVPQQAA